MSTQEISNFKGLYTATDKYSTPGSPDMHDWDIDINGNLQKTKGYTRTNPAASTTNSAYLSATSITIANPAQVMVASANWFLSASSTVILYDFNDTTFSNVVANYAWNVSAVTASAITLEGCDTSALSGTGKTAKLDPSMSFLHGFCSSGTGATLSNIECQGAFYDSTQDYIYSFLANKIEDKSYLIYTDKDAVKWRYSEGSSVNSTTIFTGNHAAYFEKYGANNIFTKNETQSGLAGLGGVFTISTTGSIICYGDHNNPTSKYLEVHKERLWAGNISAISGVVQNGGSWVQVSKFLPEKVDTLFTTTGSHIVITSELTTVYASTHTYNVGDNVYIASGTFASAQYNDLTNRMWEITGAARQTTASAYFTIDYTNTLLGSCSASASLMLRGATWSPASIVYEDALQGAGLFRCDDNDDDNIMQLKSSFGALIILRQQNPYIFTGTIEGLTVSLARSLNVPYGTVSPSVFMTAGGVWFLSQYGLSKIEGTTIKTNKNELDNIVDISYIEPIRPTYEAIVTKSGLIVQGINRLLLIHDPSTNIAYVLDVLNGNWFKWTNRLADRFVVIGEDVYAVYKYFLFKLQTGSQIFSLVNYAYQNMSSSYLTRVYSQESIVNTKIYNYLFSLIEGSPTASTTNPLTINIFFNGSASASLSFSWDVKTATLLTWNTLTTNGTLSWDTVTTTGTVTWGSLLGDLINMLEKRKYYLGAGREIQISIEHSDNSSVKVSKINLDYELLDIELEQ